MARLAGLLAASLLLFSRGLAQNDTETPAAEASSDSAAVAGDSAALAADTPLQDRQSGGKKWACKCYIGDSCWPKANDWSSLNKTVNGNLRVHVPPEAACHNKFDGPLGSIPTYNAAKCADVTANYAAEQWSTDQDALLLWKYFTNSTCQPTTNPAEPCTLGYYGVYVILAKKKEHIKAGIDFARKKNLRLIIRNTGHDFIGRSTGWGSLIINTHSFQDVKFVKKYSGAAAYTGGAVTVGAGVQGRALLTKAFAQNPPVQVMTGECPTVGVAGGLVQGGGHGPLTTLRGFAADNALEFDVLTADGQYLTVNEKKNADLFFALKGGGPSTYAVILSATFKTFPELKSAGTEMHLNFTQTTNETLWWEGVRTFHKYSNHFVDNGLYVYFEIGSLLLRIKPFVAINKTASELDNILAPMITELNAKGVPFYKNTKEFPTFYQLYIDLFEDEGAGANALTGGWMFTHQDVAQNNDQIIDAFKTVLSPRPDLAGQGFIVGHLWNAGFGMPVANSATHPKWRQATDFMISILPVPAGASLAQKADLQNVLTNVVDEALRQAGPNGCTYVNEADPYQPNWQEHFWGPVYPTLLKAKKKWDPKGLFYAIATPGTEDWDVIEDGTRLCKKT